MSVTASTQHAHEPAIPPTLDAEGRCLVCSLLVAADTLYEAVIWMSGSPSFSPEGEAGEGWIKTREKVYEARATLEKIGNSRAA